VFETTEVPYVPVPALRVRFQKSFGNILLASGRSEEREAQNIAVPTSAVDQFRELADSSKGLSLADVVWVSGNTYN
jgi:hypothetical protein